MIFEYMRKFLFYKCGLQYHSHSTAQEKKTAIPSHSGIYLRDIIFFHYNPSGEYWESRIFFFFLSFFYHAPNY